MYRGEGRQANGEQLLLFLYHEIRMMARRRLSGERPNHTLDTTALVNELYLRVADSEQQFRSEGEFVAAASHIMRRILVDHARAHKRQKRGGGQEPLQLSSLTFDLSDNHSIDVEALDDALTRLARIDPRQARVVEMRFFGGLSVQEIAGQLGVSSKTIKRDWATARSWLKATLAS
jgi:RNA polymerase sigma-70 factor (ECF subfamily)